MLYYKVDFKERNPLPSRIGRHGYYSRVYDDKHPNLHVFDDGAVASINWGTDDMMYVSGENLRDEKLKEIISQYRYYYEDSSQAQSNS